MKGKGIEQRIADGRQWEELHAMARPNSCRATVAPPCLGAQAQKWPTRPVEVIIPFPAGGSVDIIMENTGQTVHYLTGTEFHALTTADYRFKGELIRRLGLGVE
ncbi:MAG: hypothetical protein IT537_19855 [Hyphomicrobiales bacterium]|nr:hypothetical protein [Hyphomicrobiales bacterium]